MEFSRKNTTIIIYEKSRQREGQRLINGAQKWIILAQTMNWTKFVFITSSSNLFLTTGTRWQLIKQNDTLFLPKIFLAFFFDFVRQNKSSVRGWKTIRPCDAWTNVRIHCDWFLNPSPNNKKKSKIFSMIWKKEHSKNLACEKFSKNISKTTKHNH